jgi:hypothetical protein
MRGTRMPCGFSLVFSLLLSGCTEIHTPAPTGPSLLARDELRLAESDTLYLGRPADFTVDPNDGSFYVSDAFSGRIVRFDRRGSPVASYGSKGDGPGEFRDAGEVVVKDSVVAAADDARGLLNLFDRASGRYLGQQKYEGVLRSSAGGTGGEVWLGAQSLQSRTGVARWDAGAGTTRRLVSLPGEYVASQPIGGIFNGVFVAPWADTLLVGFAGPGALRLARSDGTLLDTVAVPAVRRLGVPGDFAERVEELSYPEIFQAISVLSNLHRFPDGRFALVHYDQRVDKAGSVTAKVFLSLLSPDRERACVDAVVPAGSTVQPKTAFRGDTLFVLDQTVQADRAETIVRSYIVDDRRCGWIPL